MSMFVHRRRARAAAVALFSLTAATFACGPSKPAQDATSESGEPKSGDQTAAAKSAEETPKWDSSSETAETAKEGPKSPSRSSPGSGSGSGANMSAPTTPAPAPTQRRSDVYDKEATEVVLNRAARQVKANCGHATDEDGNAKGPFGKTSVTVTLGHNGHAKGATVPSPFDGKPTGRCAIQAFSNLTFPPWSGPDTSVDWPVEIAPPTK